MCSKLKVKIVVKIIYFYLSISVSKFYMATLKGRDHSKGMAWV